MTSLIRLYSALGGGWPTEEAEASADASTSAPASP
jgi:outer membrane protein TolC